MRRQTAVDRAIAAADPPLTKHQAMAARALLQLGRRVDRVVVSIGPDGEPFSAVGEGDGSTGKVEIIVRSVELEGLPRQEFFDPPCPAQTRRQRVLNRLRSNPVSQWFVRFVRTVGRIVGNLPDSVDY